ncbi:hypothetical protein FOBRF1_013596 [Fusarium oxysporum]
MINIADVVDAECNVFKSVAFIINFVPGDCPCAKVKWKQLDIVDEILVIPPSREASPTPQEGFFYDTSGSAQQKRFHERLRDASAAGFYRSPLQDMPALPSSDGVEIMLGNSQRDPIAIKLEVCPRILPLSQNFAAHSMSGVPF